MRVRFYGLLVALLTILTIAFAESHKADLSAAASAVMAAAPLRLPRGHQLGHIRAMAGCCGSHGEHSLRRSRRQVLEPNRVSWRRAPDADVERRTPEDREHYLDVECKPFVHVLVGGVYTNINAAGKSPEDVSWTFGGGFDKFWHTRDMKGRGQPLESDSASSTTTSCGPAITPTSIAWPPELSGVFYRKTSKTRPAEAGTL